MNDEPDSGRIDPQPDGDAGNSTGDQFNDVEVQPWWRSKLNLAVLGTVLALVAGTLGFVIGNNRNIPDPNATDIGFLQDMHWHHDQAVELSLIYLALPGTRPDLRTIAREIVVGQSQETGMMIQLLRSWGRVEINDTDVAMAWMGDPVPLERMPGLASDADINAFAATSGAAADRSFVRLMVAHHEGGIHMADMAAQHASVAQVRTMATQMAGSQREEIHEMQTLLGS